MRTIVLAASLAVAGCNQLFGLDPLGGAEDDGGGSRLCGDGTRDSDVGEQCDDGDTEPGDGCDAECQFEYAVVGCSDGVRDGFLEVATWPRIAACAGRWTEPGIATARVGINCALAGDDTMISNGCAAADLCAAGWRPCQATDLGEPACPETPGFWAANPTCAGVTFVVGCGSAVGMSIVGCAPFDRTLGVGCSVNSAGGWVCDGGNERATVVHSDVVGGVLCCKL